MCTLFLKNNNLYKLNISVILNNFSNFINNQIFINFVNNKITKNNYIFIGITLKLD